MPHPNFQSQEFYERYHFDGELGAIYQKTHTLFRVWAPTATQVGLVTYPSGHEGYGSEIAMERDVKGTWVKKLPGDQHGLYYTYKVLVDGMVHEAMDPYAKACGVNGMRGMVVDLARTTPPGWDGLERALLPRFVDAIIYEINVRDMSSHPLSGISHRGKYLGLAEKGTRGPQGVWTGLSHLIELGITHAQLMPCFDFATIDESVPYPKEYNWGYDPLNYNIPEGSYATDPYQGEVRIYEFKQMIKALKEAGLRVNMDVVYNHTFYAHNSHLNRLVPGYYYRQDAHGRFSNGSGCGNELATERSMVRKMIVDSVRYWATEYKIDGFRFDLMGLIDIPTINEIRMALNEIDTSIMMYGEGWTGGHSPLPDYLKSLKANVCQLPSTGVFNDDLRDGLRGNVFHANRPGFVNGGVGMEESVESGIVGACPHDQVDYNQVIYTQRPWAAEPAQSINYVEAHDNLTLWDKLEAVSPSASDEVLIAMHRLCGAVILTSQGIPFLHAGMEFLRTKHGDYNSYRSPDEINWLDWERKCRYDDVFKYYQGLVALRKAHPAFRLGTAEEIQTHLRFLPVFDDHAVAYTLRDHANGDPWRTISVIFNANPRSIQIELPGKTWVIVVDGKVAGTKRLGQIEGNIASVPPYTAMVLVDTDSYEKSKQE
ncbi:MAG: type I pullulanase [Firmicutes bacterium]|jgi:pullulanase|nr:type I pullulanase [Bacillota bacterium]